MQVFSVRFPGSWITATPPFKKLHIQQIMGSSASKPVRSAAQAASRRQYPKKPSSPPTSQPTPPPRIPKQPETRSQGPTYHSKEQPSLTKSNAIDMDGRDPDFAASLRNIGPVNPAPTFSRSSTFSQTPEGQSTKTRGGIHPASNPAYLVYNAREQINKAVEKETEAMGRTSFVGREYLDAFTIRQVLTMRDRQGMRPGEIESLLRLKHGVVERLGKPGVVAEVS